MKISHEFILLCMYSIILMSSKYQIMHNYLTHTEIMDVQFFHLITVPVTDYI